DDLGMAVANSLAAVAAGAGQIECTINGIGERAGNAALEELVMAMRTRSDVYKNYTTSINTQEIYKTSRMVSNLTGLSVQRNKAIIGQNAFAHESGIHQDGMLKNRDTYEIMDPRSIGVPESKLVLGKLSGRHALSDRVKEMGYTIDDETLQRVYDDFKSLADRKKEVFDEDIEALLDKRLGEERKLWELKFLRVTAGTDETAMAFVELKDSAGVEQKDTAHGDGPIDAVFTAIQRITGVTVTLEEYITRAITGGKDAQGEASVRINHNGHKARGRGVSTDVIEAAAEAYLSAINRIKTVEAVKASQEQEEAEASQP
ncbi:MAG: alpha-isopropylmalate synthase regulatory domain-containing protein, partial [Phycisphaeraceae bacterium]